MKAATDKIEARELSPKLQRYAKFQIAIAIIATVITLATAITIYPLIQKRADLKAEISQLQSQRVQEIQQKNEEIEQLQKRIKELRKTTEALLPNGFTGKFGIPLETDAKLGDAKINVFEKGKKYGFDSVYIFKVAGKDMCFDEGPECYRTVAVFDSWEKANEKRPLALKANPTANEIHPFDEFCPNPKWIDEGGYENSGYYDCLKK